MLSGAADPATETVMSVLQLAPDAPQVFTCRMCVPEGAGTSALMTVPFTALVLALLSSE